jgi:hypothetical protein
VVAVARDIEIYEAVWGSPHVGHVADGDVLEWREDGFLRVRTEAGELHGYSVRPRTARVGRGVGLFAARDVEIRTKDGRALGTARRGAFLPLVRFAGAYVEVSLPPWEISGLVDRDGLTATRGPSPQPPRYPDYVENEELTFGPANLVTRCEEPIGAREDADGKLHAAQAVAGIELEGPATGSHTKCRPRTVASRVDGDPPVPPGFRAPGPFPSKAFAASHDFFRLASDAASSAAPDCETWSFHRTATGGTISWTFTSTSPLMEAVGGPKRLHYTNVDEVRGAAAILRGPTELELYPLRTIRKNDRGEIVGRLPGEGEAVSLNGWPTYLLVGESPDGPLMLSHGDRRLVAYHPDDVEVWYTRRDACERAAAAARGPSEAARLRLHVIHRGDTL